MQVKALLVVSSLQLVDLGTNLDGTSLDSVLPDPTASGGAPAHGRFADVGGAGGSLGGGLSGMSAAGGALERFEVRRWRGWSGRGWGGAGVMRKLQGFGLRNLRNLQGFRLMTLSAQHRAVEGEADVYQEPLLAGDGSDAANGPVEDDAQEFRDQGQGSREEGLVRGWGGGRTGTVPIGFSFKTPAKGSEVNPCVQGDLEPWTQELYGVSGRRHADGPLRPRAERLMQETMTEKDPARAYFESLSPLDQVQAMQIMAEHEEDDIIERQRYKVRLAARREEVDILKSLLATNVTMSNRLS